MTTTEEKYRFLVEGVQEHAIFMTDPQGTILTWNGGVERILGYAEGQWVGQHASIIFTPEDLASGAFELERETAEANGRAADVRWHTRRDGSRLWAEGVLERLTDKAGTCIGLVKVMRDATREKENDQRLAESVEALSVSEEQYRTLFGSIDVGFCIIEMLFDGGNRPIDYRFLQANPAFERHTGLVNTNGRTVREIVPELDDFWFKTYGNVSLTGESTRFENHAAAMGRWFDVYAVRVGPAEERKVALLFTDITTRKETQEALRQSEERLRESELRERKRLTDIFTQAPAFMAALRGPQHIFELANPPYTQLVGHRDILGKTAAEALPEVVEQGFIGLLDQVYQTAESFVGKAVPILLQVTPDGPQEERFLDFTYQPLFDEEGQVSGVLAHGIDLTERRRLEMERERLLKEQEQLLADARARARREALVNSVGSAILASPSDPEAILQAAVTALGEGLGVDRCYYVRYDQAKDLARIGSEWHREGLKPIAGREFAMSAYAVDRDPAYRAGSTHVVHNIYDYSPEDADAMTTIGVQALVRVPIRVGNDMTALGITSTEPRVWTEDEVRVLETVASQVQPVLTAARLQQRERNIAQQLQDALQPPSPPDLPGLALQGFYKPALEEAGVGGDFFDVFPISKERTALVVGDLSGKGLAAASEVATVRNMVRYAVYSGRTLAQAVTDLDRIMVEHNLLTGFATLFVGVYDHNERTLTYVNCGQEPGLLWRAATGRIEPLLPTGSVLGGFGSVDGYEEATACLTSGDVFALFTDGMTEVGPTRKELLEIEGLTTLFADCCAAARFVPSPSTSDAAILVKDRLISGVEAHAGVASRGDDIALLVGVVE